jgi:hypothetical protein
MLKEINIKFQKMCTLKRENVLIAYHDEGKGDTTLLFVHGSFINKAY